MLSKLDVGYVIVGHSERRAMFWETDELVRKRVRAVLSAGMTPVVCVGETLSERESGETEMVVTTQLRGALRRLTAEQRASVVVAYEPVWAIGTGRHALPDDAGGVCELLRNTVAAMGGPEAGERVRILYGGSVNPGNIANFMGQDPYRRSPGGRRQSRPRHLRCRGPVLDVKLGPRSCEVVEAGGFR